MLDSFARQMLYPAPPVPVSSPPPAPLEEVWLDLPDGGRVQAWALAAPTLPATAPLVLFFHGNGENLETLRWSGLFEEFGRLGVAILAADFPGYGRSTGIPSEEGLTATGEAAVAWARENHPDRPLVIAGWSLGAALATSRSPPGPPWPSARSRSSPNSPAAHNDLLGSREVWEAMKRFLAGL